MAKATIAFSRCIRFFLLGIEIGGRRQRALDRWGAAPLLSGYDRLRLQLYVRGRLLFGFLLVLLMVLLPGGFCRFLPRSSSLNPSHPTCVLQRRNSDLTLHDLPNLRLAAGKAVAFGWRSVLTLR